MENFPSYQAYRQLIPKYENIQQFIQIIELLKDSNLKLGLIREWRAFKYLKNNSKFGHKFMISNSSQDLQGIDIISYDDKGRMKYTFSVSGFEKDLLADYSIVVFEEIWNNNK